VSPYLKGTTEKLAGRRVDVIYNGFDPADFNFEVSPDNSYYTISHFGAFNRDRNPSCLWKALGELKQESPDFASVLKIQLIGQTDETIITEIEEEGLSENLKVYNHMQHLEGLELLAKSQILLLPLNDAPNVRGILPGKMYEYMALRRPILAIGPTDSDFARVMHETRTGFVHSFNDQQGIKSTLLKLYSEFKTGTLTINSSGFERFSRKNLALEIINLPFASTADDIHR